MSPAVIAEVVERSSRETVKVSHRGQTYDFGYVGSTGMLILYEEDERNMQDSVAVPPSECELVGPA